MIFVHAALIWQRIVDQTIGEPAVLFRWIAAALLLVVAVWAPSRLPKGTFGLAFWLIVLLLHAAIPPDERLTTDSEVTALMLQIGIAVTPLLLAAIPISRSFTLLNIHLQSWPVVSSPLSVSAAVVASRAPPVFCN